MSLRSLILIGAALLGGLITAPTVRAEDRYYMLMFASQANPNIPPASHTFALFVKVNGLGHPPVQGQIETTIISWMPASLRIEPLERNPEPGKNFSLAETLQWSATVNATVSMWGPYPIKKELYDMAVKQVQHLNSGRVQYLCLDKKWRGKGATNCIHAVSDLDVTQPLLRTGLARGNEASEIVLSHFDPHILPSRESNRWLVDRLGLNPAVIRFINPDLTRLE